jgi:hypothetical protein
LFILARACSCFKGVREEIVGPEAEGHHYSWIRGFYLSLHTPMGDSLIENDAISKGRLQA